MRLALAALVLAASPALAHPGWGLVVDTEGAVYYTDLKQVLRIGPEGGTTVAVPDVHTHELYLDPAGTLHGEHLWYESATEAWGHYDWALSKKGLVRGPAQKGFRAEGSFVKDAAGNSYGLDGAKLRITNVDQEIDEIDRAMRRLEASSYLRDINGNIYQAALPGTYYQLQDDARKLQKERQEQFDRLEKLRQQARAINQDLPVPKYTGLQRVIDVEGTPVVAPAPATEPTTQPASAPSNRTA